MSTPTGFEEIPLPTEPPVDHGSEPRERVLLAPAHMGRGAGSRSEADRLERGRGRFADIAGLLSGGLPEAPKPLILSRDDGVSVFYAGQVNLLFGEAESGKTWIALGAIAEIAKTAEGKALILDNDHNGVEAIAGKLLDLGVTESFLGDPDRCRYVEPEDKEDMLDVIAYMAIWKPTIAVVDSIGELLPMLGLNSNSPDDFTQAHTTVLKPLAMAGAAVIAIDHLAKNPDSKAAGPTGTAAKRRAIGGVSIRVKVNEQFVPGAGGSAWLTVNKDRHGGLRKYCPRGDKEPSAGLFTLTQVGTNLIWNLRAPTGMDSAAINDVSTADLEALSALNPPPGSTRDVATRLRWGNTRATTVLREWRSRNAPEEQGAAPKLVLLAPVPPVSGAGSTPDKPLPRCRDCDGVANIHQVTKRCPECHAREKAAALNRHAELAEPESSECSSRGCENVTRTGGLCFNCTVDGAS